MCIVSMVGDYRSGLPIDPNKYPEPYRSPWNDYTDILPSPQVKPNELTQEQIDSLLEIYLKALKFDEDNNEPECHEADKHKELREISKRIAALMLESDVEEIKVLTRIQLELLSLIERLNV